MLGWLVNKKYNYVTIFKGLLVIYVILYLDKLHSWLIFRVTNKQNGNNGWAVNYNTDKFKHRKAC